MDEFVVGFESRPRPATVIRLAAIARREQHLVALVNVGVPLTSYSLVRVPDPGVDTTSLHGRVSFEQAGAMLPHELINEEVLLGPITSLCSAAQLLMRKSDPETQRFARVILADASKLVDELKRLGIVSPLANDPGAC